MERSNFSSTHLEGEIMAIVTVGIDLAKNVFAVHGVDESGKSILIRPSVKRAALLELVAKLPPCLIGMEACSGAHHWAREFARFGHRHSHGAGIAGTQRCEHDDDLHPIHVLKAAAGGTASPLGALAAASP